MTESGSQPPHAMFYSPFTIHHSLLSPKPLCLQYPARNCFRSNIIRDATAPEPHILNHLPPRYTEGEGGTPLGISLTPMPHSVDQSPQTPEPDPKAYPDEETPWTGLAKPITG